MSQVAKNKIIITIYVLIINFIVMLGLYYKYLLFTSLSKAMLPFSIAMYPLGVTDSPSLHYLISEAYKINGFVIFLFILAVGILCYLSIWWENHNKVKIGIASTSLLAVIIISLLINSMLTLILLVPLLISLGSIIILKRYFDGKKVMKWIIGLYIIAIPIFVFETLISYESFGSFNIDNNEVLYLTLLSLDKFNIQSGANFTLIVTILTELQYFFLTPLIGVGVWIFNRTYNRFEGIKKEPTINRSIYTGFKILLFSSLFVKVILIIYTAAVGVMYIQINDRYAEYYPEIKDGYCFTDNYESYGLGNSIVDDNVYFDNCYTTVNGTYTVYREIAEEQGSIFDMVKKDLEYERLYIVDEEGNELISIDIENVTASIFVTTAIESAEGYDDTITVLYKGEGALGNTYDIYDLEGNLILNLPTGVPFAEQGKADSFYPYGMKLLTKDEKVLYVIKDDLGGREEFEYYFDGTIVEINP